MSHLDKDFANGNGTNGMSELSQVKTEGSIVLTPEMFERMYLAPQMKVDGGLRKILGNPTPSEYSKGLTHSENLLLNILQSVSVASSSPTAPSSSPSWDSGTSLVTAQLRSARATSVVRSSASFEMWTQTHASQAVYWRSSRASWSSS